MDMEIVTAVLGITGSSFKIMDTVSNLISKSINTRQERPPFNLNVRFQNERAKERYLLLYNQIFLPLYYNIVTIGPKIQGHLRELEFTGGIIRRSVHYDEGIEHLNLDVLAFSQQFEDLENNVRRLNDCIENIDSSIYEMVTDFLVGNGLTVITGVGRNPVDREILIDNLIPYLYSYYYKREEFTVQVWPNDPFWRVKGAAIANSDSISDMKDYIEMLRDHDNIRLTIQDINDEIKNLIVLGQKLSVNIGMNVIRLVENGEYTTTCKYCEKYISN